MLFRVAQITLDNGNRGWCCSVAYLRIPKNIEKVWVGYLTITNLKHCWYLNLHGHLQILHILQRLKAWIALVFSFHNQTLLLNCHVTLCLVFLSRNLPDAWRHMLMSLHCSIALCFHIKLQSFACCSNPVIWHHSCFYQAQEWYQKISLNIVSFLQYCAAS